MKRCAQRAEAVLLKRCRNTVTPWEACPPSHGSWDVPPTNLLLRLCPVPPIPCHRAGWDARWGSHSPARPAPDHVEVEWADTSTSASQGGWKAPFLCFSSMPATSHWHRTPPHDLSLGSPASHQSFHDFLPQFWAVIWLQTEPFDSREPKMNCKEACVGLGFSPKPWLLFFKCPSDTCLCLRRFRNLRLSKTMSTVYPQPLHSKSNHNQIPLCYPAFSTALTWQCHPL